jgi:hypothetical protein
LHFQVPSAQQVAPSMQMGFSSVPGSAAGSQHASEGGGSTGVQPDTARCVFPEHEHHVIT